MGTPDDDALIDGHPPDAARGRLRLLLDPASPALTIVGILTVVAGFVLIAVGWYDVSGTANVAFQLPYLVSSALTGLGLIVIGVATAAIAAKRHDAYQRLRRLDQLETALREAPLGTGGDAQVSADRAPRRTSVRELLTGAAARNTIVLAAGTLVGLGVIFATWWGVSGTYDVSSQVAYIVSGGLGGLAVTLTGAGLLCVHIGRWTAAREDVALDRLIDVASEKAERRAIPPTGRRRSASRPLRNPVDTLQSIVPDPPSARGANRA